MNATMPEPDHRSNESRGREINVTAGLMLVLAWIFVGLRLKIRWPWASLTGWDDLAVVLGTVIATAASGTVFRAVECGLGKHVWDLKTELLGHLTIAIRANDILSVTALCFSKLAVSLLILRLSTFQRHIHAAWIVTVLIVIWGMVAVTGSAVAPEDIGLRRFGWILVGTYSIVLEMLLFALPIFLVWPLKLRLAAKLTIVGGFAFRIPASILTVLRVLVVIQMLTDRHEENVDQLDLTWDYVKPTIYSSVETYYSLMAATIPCMHLFLKAFTKDWLRDTAAQAGPTARARRPSAFLISSLLSKLSSTAKSTAKSTQSQRSTMRDSMTDAAFLYRADGGTTTWVTHQNSADVEDLQNVMTNASEHKIMVQQTVEVQYDDKPRAAERALLQI